jgi:hypothetical protein
MSHCHKLVQSWSTQNDVEWEADLRDNKKDALRAEALCHPECDKEGDATARHNQNRSPLLRTGVMAGASPSKFVAS